MKRTEIRAMVALFDREIKRLEEIDEGAACTSCAQWSGGCLKAAGAVPPPEVVAVGCDEWEETDPPIRATDNCRRREAVVNTPHRPVPQHVRGKPRSNGFDDWDDDIPF